MVVSIFNDVIGPVMRGPSSSHCAAALRIGRLARELAGAELREVLVEFDRGGSLPTTHESQGSDMGLFGGLMGWDAADERLPDSMRTFQESGVKVRIETVDTGDPHPNTYRLTLVTQHERHTLRAISTGGGMMEVIDVDGFAVSIFGDYFETLLWTDQQGVTLREKLSSLMEMDAVLLHEREGQQLVEVKAQQFVSEALLDELSRSGLVRTVRRLAPVLPVRSRRDTRVPFTTCAKMLRHDAGRGTPLWQLALEYERARGGLGEAEVIAKMTDIVRILRRSIAQGIAGTHYEDRVLGYQCGRFNELMQAGRLLDGGALNRIILYVTALMEVKSAMGVIVASPTAGACAALPGAVIAMAEAMGLGEEDMVKALLASGVIGVFIATRWTFAAEVGGCQAEGGSAASMAAAALVTLAHGSLGQAVAAASMAFQSMIGLICDPVANRVEVPCLGKNVMAASNALACANMALAGYDPVIPFDEVLETAQRVAGQMPRELRCTALGGLSITPASIVIEQKLAAKKASCAAAQCGCAKT
ncbi:MAG: L-serine ammonia-lyase, iron-sulfur-dependent, subunit alpha [Verrucomicrobia bacterium]|nr:L-serine ammonia-lyase, iron-sulfur-dependent, subunit alpha [Verrucomicrobiota bacterium]